MFIFNFFLGALIIVAAAFSIKYNYEMVNTFGRNNIFERKLGPGTTYPMFKILGILAIIFGFLIMTSMFDNFLDFVFGPVTGTFLQ